MNQITKALLFATKAHADRTCNDRRLPYMAHVLDTFRTLSYNSHNESALVALLLHDTMEYNSVTLDIIKSSFGDDVAGILEPLLSVDKLKEENQWPNKPLGNKERKTLQFISKEATKDQLLLLISLMTHNLQEIQKIHAEKAWPEFPEDKQITEDRPVPEDEVFDYSGYAVEISKEKMASIAYYEEIIRAFRTRENEVSALEELIPCLEGEIYWFLQ
jgi:hypothetical protein